MVGSIYLHILHTHFFSAGCYFIHGPLLALRTLLPRYRFMPFTLVATPVLPRIALRAYTRGSRFTVTWLYATTRYVLPHTRHARCHCRTPCHARGSGFSTAVHTTRLDMPYSTTRTSRFISIYCYQHDYIHTHTHTVTAFTHTFAPMPGSCPSRLLTHLVLRPPWFVGCLTVVIPLAFYTHRLVRLLQFGLPYLWTHGLLCLGCCDSCYGLHTHTHCQVLPFLLPWFFLWFCLGCGSRTVLGLPFPLRWFTLPHWFLATLIALLPWFP